MGPGHHGTWEWSTGVKYISTTGIPLLLSIESLDPPVICRRLIGRKVKLPMYDLVRHTFI